MIPMSVQRADIGHDSTQLYLDLLKRSLTDYLHIDRGFADKREVLLQQGFMPKDFLVNALVRLLRLRRMRLYYIRNQRFDLATKRRKREEGKDYPDAAETMIGMKRMDNIQACIESVLQRDVPGDFLEAGVWRGGATIFMRGILQAYGVKNRTVWVADSFEGLPPPDAQYPVDQGDTHHLYDELRVSLDDVKANFEKYGLLDDQVCFLKGWFDKTLYTDSIKRLAVLRLDGDMYGSTLTTLEALYDKVSPGGFVIVDDYMSLRCCQQAVDDFRAKTGITDEILPIDWSGVYWQKRMP